MLSGVVMRLRLLRTPGLVLLLALAACDEDRPEDEAFGVVDPEDFPDAGLGSLEPTYGFHEGERAEFYRFGDVGVVLNDDGKLQGAPVNAMYWFYRDGEPLFDYEADPDHPGGYRLTEESQYPIIDYLPGREDYSPYWQLVRVEVPSYYEANDVKSLATLRDAVDSADFSLDRTGDAIHCPVVDSEAELLQGVSNRDRVLPRVPLWFRRLKTYCYLFERPDDFLGAEGFPMPAACVRVGPDDPADTDVDCQVLSIPGMELHFPRIRVEYDTGEKFEAFPPDGILTEFLPGADGYSPLARVFYYRVVPGFPFGGYTSLSDIDPSLSEPADPEMYQDYPLRGTVPACTTSADCDDGLSPPLACNTETGYCDAPPVGYAQHCGPGIARCDATPSANFPMGLACTSLRIQVERFCYRRCDWEEDDTDSGPNDSRCDSIPGMTCARTLRVIEENAGVCLRECNSLRGAPETVAANSECELDMGDDEFDSDLDGAIYGPANPTAPFDLDDNPFEASREDAAEPDGRVDLMEGTTCLVSSRDLCAWPDSRAEALRQAGAGQ